MRAGLLYKLLNFMSKAKLTAKHLLFLRAYAKSLNLTTSVKTAYPGISNGSARSYGSYLRNKHPIVSKVILSLEQKIADTIDPLFLICKYKKIYEDHYLQTFVLTTKASDGILVKQEYSGTPIAMQALAYLTKLSIANSKYINSEKQNKIAVAKLNTNT